MAKVEMIYNLILLYVVMGSFFKTPPLIVNNGLEYIMTLPEQDGNEGYYPHLAIKEIQVCANCNIYNVQ